MCILLIFRKNGSFQGCFTMEGKRDFEGISQSCTEVFDYKYVLEIRLALRLYFDWIFFRFTERFDFCQMLHRSDWL